MKASFLIFIITDIFLLATTATTGLLVVGPDGYPRHFLLGLLAAFFTCVIHIVLFMYFTVQQKIVAQAIQAGDLDISFGERLQKYKSRAIKLSMLGIVAIIMTSSLGATIEIGVPAEVHLLMAFLAIFANAFIFYFQFDLLDNYSGFFTEAFGE